MVTLDKQHRRVLAYIYQHPYILFDKVNKRYTKYPINEIGSNLLSWNLVRYTSARSLAEEVKYPNSRLQGNKPGCYAVTCFDGNVIVEQNRRMWFSLIFPIAISLLSLIVSFIGVCQ